MTSAQDRRRIMGLVKEAVDMGAPVPVACRELGISARTHHRWRRRMDKDGTCEDRRPSADHPDPACALSEEERREVLGILNSPEFADATPAEVVPALADRGRYVCSESTMYRILREEKMLHHRGRAAKPVRREVARHEADGPDKLWSWDITYLNGPAKGMFFYLYVILDVFSRKIVGWEVWEEESGEHASELIRRASLAEGRLSTSPLVLHSDNGSPMKAATMLATLRKLGITPSNSRPHVSNDNAYSEAAFRTLKYHPTYDPSGFADLDEAREWCMRFVRWYNEEHHHSGIKFLTPVQRHSGEGLRLMEARRGVYEAAKAMHPGRWNGRRTRNWDLPSVVMLNSDRSLLGHEATPEKQVA